MPPLRGMGLIRKILCLRKISDGLRRGGRETEKGDEIMIWFGNWNEIRQRV